MFEKLLEDYSSIKRMRYFLYQMLQVEDFNAEQKYHRDMRYLHNAVLHGYGIVEGLEVTKANDTDDTKVDISPGIAINLQGQELVLATKEPNVPIPTGGKPIYIKLIAVYQPVLPQKEKDENTCTRILEIGKAIATEEEVDLDKGEVLLAKITVQSGKIEDIYTSQCTKVSTIANLELRLKNIEDRLFKPSWVESEQFSIDTVAPDGNDRLTIWGRNFDYEPTVSLILNGHDPIPLTVVTYTSVEITVTVPTGTSKTDYQIRVHTSQGEITSTKKIQVG